MPCPRQDSWSSPPFPGDLNSPGLCWRRGVSGLGAPAWGGQRGSGGQPPQPAPSLYPPPSPAVCCILSKAAWRRLHPAHRLLLGMAGYLSKTDFVMVEEGFSTRDLLEELTLGASQATAVRDWEWGWVSCSLCRPSCLLWKDPCGPHLPSYLAFSPCCWPETGSFDPHFLVFAPNFVLPACPALMNSTTTIYPAL